VQGLPLGASLHAFLAHLGRLLPPPATYILATDGPWDLSVVLAREAAAKHLNLPPSLTTFFDLRTEFSRALPHAGRPHNRASLLAALHLPPPPSAGPRPTPAAAAAASVAHVRALAGVVARLLASGHAFVSPVQPPPLFAPVVTAGVPAADIVRLRGLPWSATEADVLNFFSSVPATPGGVRFVRNAAGKATGEAFLQVPLGSMDRALRRHRHMMGPRYVEVFASSPADMAAHLARCDGRGAREGRRADPDEAGGGGGVATPGGRGGAAGATPAGGGGKPMANGARGGRHRSGGLSGPSLGGLPRPPPAVSLLLRRLPGGTDAAAVRRLLTAGGGGVAAASLGAIHVTGGPASPGGGAPATAMVEVYGEASALAAAKARSLQLDVMVVAPEPPRAGGAAGGRSDGGVDAAAAGMAGLSVAWGPPGGGAPAGGHGFGGGGGGHPSPMYARSPHGMSANRMPPPPPV